jgi:RNA polymerase sigma-70 factor (ECF subfamily)
MELMARRDEVSESEETTFTRLYEECRLPVYRFLRTLCRSDEEAADIAATVFERAWRGFGRLDRRRPALPWVLAIARNAAIDGRRRMQPTVSLDNLGVASEPVSAEQPEASYARAESAAGLRASVLRLPEVQRDAIALRYGAGLTAREIAGVIGKSEAATQKLLERALGILRESHDARS